MAKSSRRTASPKGNAPLVEAGVAVPPDPGGNDEHLIVFKIAHDCFAFRLGDVGEIVRVPTLAHMPFGPKSLLGLANLRGEVLPVVDVRGPLGFPGKSPDGDSRVIVIDRGAPVAFVVDRIETLLTVSADRVESNRAGAGSVDPELLDGVVKGAEGDGTIKILNPHRLLRNEFSQLGTSRTRIANRVAISAGAGRRAAPEQQLPVSLVSFDLGQQEYALPLERVREIIPLPDQICEVPHAETAILGVVTLRDRLLPLVSLRVLLGLPDGGDREQRGKVVVMSAGRGAIGLVTDRTREVLRVDPSVIDPAPALLTRGAGEAEITSICRLDQGRRLVAMLSPEGLFRSEEARRILAEQIDAVDDPTDQPGGVTMADEQFIIFRLGSQEYGLPIKAVDEIARAPDHVTRLPKSPSFIDGVINLRGTVVPIVDLRRRFELTSQEPASAPRILVLAVGGGKTGFMVDGVSEIMSVPAGAIQPAPEVSSEQMRLIGRVANLHAQDRMILLVDPAQLLDRVEEDMLAKFDRTDSKPASKAS